MPPKARAAPAKVVSKVSFTKNKEAIRRKELRKSLAATRKHLDHGVQVHALSKQRDSHFVPEIPRFRLNPFTTREVTEVFEAPGSSLAYDQSKRELDPEKQRANALRHQFDLVEHQLAGRRGRCWQLLTDRAYLYVRTLLKYDPDEPQENIEVREQHFVVKYVLPEEYFRYKNRHTAWGAYLEHVYVAVLLGCDSAGIYTNDWYERMSERLGWKPHPPGMDWTYCRNDALNSCRLYREIREVDIQHPDLVTEVGISFGDPDQLWSEEASELFKLVSGGVAPESVFQVETPDSLRTPTPPTPLHQKENPGNIQRKETFAFEQCALDSIDDAGSCPPSHPSSCSTSEGEPRPRHNRTIHARKLTDAATAQNNF